MTTDTQDLIARLRTDHAFDSTTKGNEAADRLEAFQAEIAEWKNEAMNGGHADRLRAERDEALARLAEVEAHHKEVLSDLDTRISYAESQRPTLEQFDTWWNGSKYMQVVFSDMNTRQVALDGWNAAAGASPVEPKHKLPLTNKELANPEYMRGYVEELNALIAELLASRTQPSQDAGPNAPWLSEAHMLCTDQGIAQGNIADRIRALRDKLAQPSQAGELSDKCKPVFAWWCESSDCITRSTHALNNWIAKGIKAIPLYK